MDILFQNLLNSIPLPVRVIELSSTGEPVYLLFNRTALVNSGMTLEKVQGKTAAQAFPDEWGQEATRQHANVFETGEPLTHTHKMRLAAGVRNLQTTLVPLPVEDDSKKIIIATTIDSTDQLMSESEWLKAETLHQEILRFTELAAHDLRSPMRHVMALTDLIRDGFQDLGDGKLEALDKLESVSERTAVLITELLASSKEIVANREFEEFDLGVLCSDLFVMLDPLRRHNLTRDAVRVSADRATVQITLRNVIDNALKHNYPARIDLHVGVSASGRAKQLIFTVKDSGKGFANPETAFEDKSESHEHSGFGLPAIRRMLLLQGGSIRAETAPDQKGATLVMALPGSLK